jgi:hypothetical protein
VPSRRCAACLRFGSREECVSGRVYARLYGIRVNLNHLRSTSSDRASSWKCGARRRASSTRGASCSRWRVVCRFRRLHSRTREKAAVPSWARGAPRRAQRCTDHRLRIGIRRGSCRARPRHGGRGRAWRRRRECTDGSTRPHRSRWMGDERRSHDPARQLGLVACDPVACRVSPPSCPSRAACRRVGALPVFLTEGVEAWRTWFRRFRRCLHLRNGLLQESI